MTRSGLLLACCLTLPTIALGNTETPYAGQETRAIASLSAEEIEGLRAGAGLGYAISAELNGYPGPRHLLDLADEIGLSAEQIAAIEAVFAEMNAEARTLGEARIAAEAALDDGLRGRARSMQAALDALVAEAGRADAALRAVHLAAHLEVKPLLSRHQIMMYNRLRGYGAGDQEGHGSHGGHGNH